jgi:hypothetical protein
MTEISLADLVKTLGPTVVRVLCAPTGVGHAVGEPELLDTTDPSPTSPSALLLGIGLHVDDADRIAEAVGQASRHNAAALVVKCRDTDPGALLELATRFGVAVLDAVPEVPWRRLEALCATVLRGQARRGRADLAHVPNGDLFALANAVAAIAGGAVAIMDTNQVIIAYSSLDGQPIDDTRSRSILSRRVPADALPNFLAPTVWNSRSGVRVKREGDMDRLAVVIRAGSEVLGSLWVAVGDDTDLVSREAALQEAAKLAALHMLQLRRRTAAEQERRDQALLAVLESTGTGLEFPGYLLALTSRGPTDATRRHLSSLQVEDMLALDAASFRLSIATTLISDRLYVHVPAAGSSGRQAAIFARHVVDRAKASLHRDFLAVLGTEAANPAALRTQRTDIDSALGHLTRTGVHTGVVDLETVRADLVLHRITSLVAEREDLRSGMAERITGHDAGKGSDYAASLHAYLRSFGDIVAVAEALHVHQNTLRHRLRRAEELFGIDLRRPEHLLLLWLELEARES